MKYWPLTAFDILKLNSDWLWVVDSRGQLIEWTPCLEDKAYSLQRWPKGYGNWAEFIRPNSDLRPNVRDLYRAIKARRGFRSLRVACRLPHLDVNAELRVSGVPVYDEDNNFMGYRGSASNHTGAAMAERKISRQQQLNNNLEQVLAETGTAMFIANICRDGYPVEFATTAAAEVLGLSPADILGAETTMLLGRFLSVEQQQALFQLLEGSRSGRLQFPYLRPDGQPITVELAISRKDSPNRTHCAIVGTLRDITREQHQLELQKQHERLRALGQMAGGIAHEINNLLQPATLYTEMLRDHLPPDAEAVESLSFIEDSLSQIRFIVGNTLQFVRVHKEGSPSPQEFSGLLRERLAYIRAMVPATIVVHDTEITNSPLKAAITSTQLTQILTNLVNNAAQAMAGRGHLHVALRQVNTSRMFMAHPLPSGDYFEMRVRDTGPGIPEAIRQHIFEPFYTTKPAGQGSGLGLSVVYGLVLELGGHIHAASPPGAGAEFTIYLPVAEDQTRGGENGKDFVGGRCVGNPEIRRAGSAAGRA